MTELQEFINECSSEEIQKHYPGKGGEFSINGTLETRFCNTKEHRNNVWLPDEGELMDILGNKFKSIGRYGKDLWAAYRIETTRYYKGQSARMALINAIFKRE